MLILEYDKEATGINNGLNDILLGAKYIIIPFVLNAIFGFIARLFPSSQSPPEPPSEPTLPVKRKAEKKTGYQGGF